MCTQLRSAVTDALDKGNAINVRVPLRADIIVEARVMVVDERVDRQFGTTFAVRNFSIEIDGMTRVGETVPMPAPTTVSFDPQFGSERGAEKARVVAGDIAARIKAFVQKKRGG